MFFFALQYIQLYIYILGSRLQVNMSDKRISSSIGKLQHNVIEKSNCNNNHKKRNNIKNYIY